MYASQQAIFFQARACGARKIYSHQHFFQARACGARKIFHQKTLFRAESAESVFDENVVSAAGACFAINVRVCAGCLMQLEQAQDGSR